jgi:hypothetical protein
MSSTPPAASELQDVAINSDAITKIEKTDQDDKAMGHAGNSLA